MLGNIFMRTRLPYLLLRKSDGKFLVLDRRYEPIGEPIKFERFGKAKMRKLSCHDDKQYNYFINQEELKIFFYSDSCHPAVSKANMKSYMDKLAILALLNTVIIYN